MTLLFINFLIYLQRTNAQPEEIKEKLKLVLTELEEAKNSEVEVRRGKSLLYALGKDGYNEYWGHKARFLDGLDVVGSAEFIEKVINKLTSEFHLLGTKRKFNK